MILNIICLVIIHVEDVTCGGWIRCMRKRNKDKQKIYNKTFYDKNREILKQKNIKNVEKSKSRYKTDPEFRRKRCLYLKEYRMKNIDYLKSKEKENHLKHKFKISLDEYNDMLNLQNFKCKICEVILDFNRKKFVCVDHCHETNIVRGILCRNCNLMLGFSLEDISTLEKGIEYIKKYGKNKIHND